MTKRQDLQHADWAVEIANLAHERNGYLPRGFAHELSRKHSVDVQRIYRFIHRHDYKVDTAKYNHVDCGNGHQKLANSKRCRECSRSTNGGPSQVCSYCGTAFIRRGSKFRPGQVNRYCSQKCFGLSDSSKANGIKGRTINIRHHLLGIAEAHEGKLPRGAYTQTAAYFNVTRQYVYEIGKALGLSFKGGE